MSAPLFVIDGDRPFPAAGRGHADDPYLDIPVLHPRRPNTGVYQYVIGATVLRRGLTDLSWDDADPRVSPKKVLATERRSGHQTGVMCAV